jgi:CHAD domain-containing protein
MAIVSRGASSGRYLDTLYAPLRRTPSLREARNPELLHEIRVLMKKLKALLRLVRPRIKPEADRLTARLQGIGSELSAIRDRDIFALWARAHDLRVANHRRTLAEIRLILRARLAILAIEKPIKQILRIDHLTDKDFSKLFDRSWKRARKAFRRAKAERRDTDLHRLRRRIKDLQYQSKALPALCSRRPRRKVTAALKRAGALLGDAHDRVIILECIQSRHLRSSAGLRKALVSEMQSSEIKALKICARVFAASDIQKFVGS